MKRPKIGHSLITLYSNIASIDILLTCLKKKENKEGYFDNVVCFEPNVPLSL